MNLKNLETVIGQARAIGVSEKSIARMEEQMRNDVPRIQLTDGIQGEKGNTEATTFLQQSSRTDSYYLHKFEIAHHRGKVPEPGHKFFITSSERDGKIPFETREHTLEAIALFNAQKGDSQLSWGKQFKDSAVLAVMENGKVTELNREFERTFNSIPQTQTVWLENGKSGFTIPQMANMIENRYVHRDDLLNSLKGEVYSAWTKLDFDSPKDRGNYNLLQYSDPAYGFDMKAELAKYQIKELENEKDAKLLYAALKDGFRTPVTAFNQDGAPNKVFIELEVRYGNINIFDQEGNRLMRENYLAEGVKNDLLQDKGKARGKDQEVSQEISR